MRNKQLFSVVAIALLGLSLGSCGGGKGKSGNGKNMVISRAMSDPDMLNPINVSSSDGRNLCNLIFPSLLGTDPKTLEIVPYLAVARPTITEVTEGEHKGGLKIDYEIRKEAVWDNGTPVTAKDYAFTLKMILNPNIKNANIGPYYEWLSDMKIDSANPKKFSLFSSQKYFMIEEFSGYYVLPQYIYDAAKITDKYNISDLNTSAKRAKMKDNADLRAAADNFNSEKFQREKGSIVSCGAYDFAGWETGQKIELVKKKNWWGANIKERAFEAKPDKITYKMIKDPNAAVTALKDGQIDEMNGIEGKLYEELLTNETAKKKLNLQCPPVLAYSYFGMNLKNPKLKDIKVREALAHAINKEEINKVIGFSRGKLVETFVHPSQKHFCADLKPWGFDLDKSRALLDEAGWKDTDGDGFRDKVINGVKTKLSLDYKFPAANKGRESTGIMIKEDFKKIGVELVITGREWSVYLQDMDEKNFETTYGGFTIASQMSDPKQQWHTSSSKAGGDNSVSWGNAESDKLIDDIRSDMNEATRVEKYKKLEKMIHDDIPFVFMFSPANRLGINKRFKVETTLANPGYMVNEFELSGE